MQIQFHNSSEKCQLIKSTRAESISTRLLEQALKSTEVTKMKNTCIVFLLFLTASCTTARSTFHRRITGEEITVTLRAVVASRLVRWDVLLFAMNGWLTAKHFKILVYFTKNGIVLPYYLSVFYFHLLLALRSLSCHLKLGWQHWWQLCVDHYMRICALFSFALKTKLI